MNETPDEEEDEKFLAGEVSRPVTDTRAAVQLFEFGMRVKEVRKLYGWDQRRLAAECDVGFWSIRKVERGECLNVVTLLEVAEALGVPFRKFWEARERWDVRVARAKVKAKEAEGFYREHGVAWQAAAAGLWAGSKLGTRNPLEGVKSLE